MDLLRLLTSPLRRSLLLLRLKGAACSRKVCYNGVCEGQKQLFYLSILRVLLLD